MIHQIKKWLYFPLASYFAFFAKIVLWRWRPKIVVVTGSSGKTTLLHLIESQLGNKAKYSHFANSSFGIPFDILGLKRQTLLPSEWFYLFFSALFSVFKKIPKENLYIVEADCDRPNEGRFLSNILKPDITLLTGISLTHSKNFDHLAVSNKFPSVEKAIAYEFGYFLEKTKSLIVTCEDSRIIKDELARAKAKTIFIGKKDLQGYKVGLNNSEFIINNRTYKIKSLLPKDAFYSIATAITLLKSLKIKSDLTFSKLILPPGRSSVFAGIKNTTIIDSSYNASLNSMQSMLELLSFYPKSPKWAVLGDMLELGLEEKKEHEKLAKIIQALNLDKVILVGPRLAKYTYSKLNRLDNVQSFLLPKEALNFLRKKITGNEVILFKGARFLEGIIEHLLLDKNDVVKLCRREKVWEIRRKQWGL